MLPSNKIVAKSSFKQENSLRYLKIFQEPDGRIKNRKEEDFCAPYLCRSIFVDGQLAELLGRTATTITCRCLLYCYYAEVE